MNILNEIKGALTIGISGHVNPDGDCVGAVMGLYLYLSKKVPEAAIDVFLEKPAPIFECIKSISVVNSEFTTKVEHYDVFFCIDTVKDRLGQAESLFDKAIKKINIDHHVSNSGCGDVNYVIPHASSASELIYDLIEDKNDIDVDIAEAIYLGMVHDTGVFRFSNTSPETMRKAADLLEFGFDFSRLIDCTYYEKTYIQNQILGRALLESILFMDKKCLVSMIDKKTMDFYGASSDDLSGIVNQLKNTSGVECAIFIYQTAIQEYKVSLRSGGEINVAKIASFFGGGGHVRAAGVTMRGTCHDVINNLSLHIEQQFKENKKNL